MIRSLNRKLGLTILSAVVLTAFAGCKTVSQRDYDAAIEENTTLRDRINALQASADQAGNANQSYIDQNNDLRSENQRLSDALAASRANPATGFEGINGVDIGRRSGGEIVVGVEADVLFNSAARALAVESYLVGKGVDNDKAYSAAFGPSNARATKKDSRRVEIVILGN